MSTGKTPEPDRPLTEAEAARGGKGDTTTDARLAARAIKARWPIPDDTREELARSLRRMIDDPNTSERGRVAAHRALLDADRLNLDAEQLEELRRANDQLQTAYEPGEHNPPR